LVHALHVPAKLLQLLLLYKLMLLLLLGKQLLLLLLLLLAVQTIPSALPANKLLLLLTDGSLPCMQLYRRRQDFALHVLTVHHDVNNHLLSITAVGQSFAMRI
jgi:hypothetical protein